MLVTKTLRQAMPPKRLGGSRMYTFPDDMRKAYESSPLSFVYYDVVDGAAQPLLATDGFCKKTGMDRERVLAGLSEGMY